MACVFPASCTAMKIEAIFPWQRLHVICEERITGTTAFAADSPAALVPAIAGFFSHLHTVRRDSWGNLSERNRDGLHEYLLAKTRGRLQQWKTLDGSLPQRVPERCTAWMSGRKTAVNNIIVFQPFPRRPQSRQYHGAGGWQYVPA